MSGDLDRETRAFVPELAGWQRKKMAELGQKLIELSASQEGGRREALEAIEWAWKAISGFELRDLRSKVRCASCWEAFTSNATRRQHYGSLGQCVNPAEVETLRLCSGDRWGWSETAVEEFKARQAEERKGG